MTYKENITAILECYFTGFKKEIIDSACNRILEQKPKLLQALEQEKGAYNALVKNIQCSDAISRQAVLDKKELVELEDGQSFYCISPEDVETLPSVNPQPKTGHWIFDEILDKHYYCSECKSMGVDYWDYCPYCGAKMIDPQKSEKINCKATKCENCQNHNYCDYEPQESEE